MLIVELSCAHCPLGVVSHVWEAFPQERPQNAHRGVLVRLLEVMGIPGLHICSRQPWTVWSLDEGADSKDMETAEVPD